MRHAVLPHCGVLLIALAGGACAHDRRDQPPPPPAAVYYGPVTNYYGPVTITGPALPYGGPPSDSPYPGYGPAYSGGYDPGAAWGPPDYGYGAYGYGTYPSPWPLPSSDPAYDAQRLDPWAGYDDGPGNGYW